MSPGVSLTSAMNRLHGSEGQRVGLKLMILAKATRSMVVATEDHLVSNKVGHTTGMW